MKILSKILISLFFLLSTFYLLPSIAHADTVTQVNNLPPSNTNPDVPNNLHNWTQSVMIEVTSALTCQIAGIDPINPVQGCLGVDQTSGKIGFLENTGLPDEALAKSGGAIGFMGNMIAALYTPPLHTADYFKDLASNFGISKPALAQNEGGTGFQSLTPLINIWSAFRNIVYLLLVIVFVVIGLAIMLRVKIDPRTVMTIQNQIPKIIVGILAVTFSFAIAGFLVDLMWVSIYLIYSTISQAGDVNQFNPVNLQGRNPFGALGAGNIFGIASSVSSSIQDILLNLFGFGNLNGINRLLTGIFTLGISELPYIIPYLIILIAILIALFRLWFTLLMAYVQILLAVVLAPFWIIGGIVPGSPISLSGWLRNISANLLAFPATIAMFMLGKVFLTAFGTNQTQGQFVPPLIGSPGTPGAIGSLISLGIILMTPNVVNMLKAALKAPKTETGIGKALMPGLAMPGRTVRGAGGLIFGNTMERGFIDSKDKDVERSALGRFGRLLGIAPR